MSKLYNKPDRELPGFAELNKKADFDTTTSLPKEMT